MPKIAELITLLRRQKGQPLRFKELIAHFEDFESEPEALRRQLDQLVDAGAVRHARGGRFFWAGRGLVDGFVRVRRDGKASLRSRRDPAEVLGTFSERDLKPAIDGDYVLATIDRRGSRRFARVIEVLERQQLRLVGQLVQQKGELSLIPEDRRLPAIRIVDVGQHQLTNGALAAVELVSDGGRTQLCGKLVDVFGAVDSLDAEIRAIAFKYGLPHHFPAPVLQAAEALTKLPPVKDEPGRRDLRHLPLVTIDGATAKDFDDAVAATVEEKGFRLWVCIADVSHYVIAGDSVDREAYQRGTSVYFPDYCIPMLPEQLSNGLCSLQPDQDRLVMCAEMQFDRQGKRQSSQFYPAVIRSHARWVYERVAQLITEPDQAEGDETPLLPSLQAMSALADLLRTRRMKRGSLDFDLPEPEVLLDLRGRPDRIVFADRTDAHRLIEELMLAANEAVATFLREKEAPYLSRIHEPPALEKVQEFQQMVAQFNFGMTIDPRQSLHEAFADFLSHLRGHPLEPLLNRFLLRTMTQACYSPEARGHFGLAAEDYCHFTSPIRRYPDLMVHRALKHALQQNNAATVEKDLFEAGVHCSTLERRAMEAEREIIQLKKCQFMADRIGERYSGCITSVVSFGLFVELDTIPVEGLVPLSSMDDDYYHFDAEMRVLTGEKRRRRFQLGDKVDIIVANVDLFQREINLELVGSATAPKQGQTKPLRGRRRR